MNHKEEIRRLTKTIDDYENSCKYYRKKLIESERTPEIKILLKEIKYLKNLPVTAKALKELYKFGDSLELQQQKEITQRQTEEIERLSKENYKLKHTLEETETNRQGLIESNKKLQEQLKPIPGEYYGGPLQCPYCKNEVSTSLVFTYRYKGNSIDHILIKQMELCPVPKIKTNNRTEEY